MWTKDLKKIEIPKLFEVLLTITLMFKHQKCNYRHLQVFIHSRASCYGLSTTSGCLHSNNRIKAPGEVHNSLSAASSITSSCARRTIQAFFKRQFNTKIENCHLRKYKLIYGKQKTAHIFVGRNGSSQQTGNV